MQLTVKGFEYVTLPTERPGNRVTVALKALP